jgi:hypothetical protein
MPSGFHINEQAIAKMAEEIQREFAKHPIRIPLEADDSGLALPAASTSNYYGPVVQVTSGDHAQLAWDNRDVTQSQSNLQDIAPGYEALAEAMVRTLQSIELLGLPAQERNEVKASVNEIFVEVTKATPDKPMVKRLANVVKGLLASAALGANQATTAESQALTTHLIHQIATSLT